jgi:hypothetical protein
MDSSTRYNYPLFAMLRFRDDIPLEERLRQAGDIKSRPVVRSLVLVTVIAFFVFLALAMWAAWYASSVWA